MEKEVNNQERRELFLKFLPIVILGITLLVVGLCFIPNFYLIKVDGVKKSYSFLNLLSGGGAGTSITVFFILIYIALPVLAACLLFLNIFHKNFAFISLFIFLFSAIVSIVSKDVFAEVLASKLELEVSIKEVYVPAIIPTIGFFILSIMILSFSINDIKFTTRDITESGILIAAALALNFLKLFPAPTGGSVNLQMLPLFLLAIRRGPLKGFIGCGIVYGLISCLTDGYGFAFFPFDYLLAFGGASFLGFFSKYILVEDTNNYNLKGELMLLIGGIGATVIRFIGGTISSMLFYSFSIAEAMLYNVGYVFISGAIALAVLMALYGPLLRINKVYPPQKSWYILVMI